jgi:hypothetical protein
MYFITKLYSYNDKHHSKIDFNYLLFSHNIRQYLRIGSHYMDLFQINMDLHQIHIMRPNTKILTQSYDRITNNWFCVSSMLFGATTIHRSSSFCIVLVLTLNLGFWV